MDNRTLWQKIRFNILKPIYIVKNKLFLLMFKAIVEDSTWHWKHKEIKNAYQILEHDLDHTFKKKEQ
jgi:hypothetical protein